jgi:HNH endonuclease
MQQDCWPWLGHTDRDGYGKITRGRHGEGSVSAHHVSYLIHNGGALPPGTEVVDHLCVNPTCVRPDHLEAVTQAENVRRGWDRGNAYLSGPPAANAAKTHCKRGHELSPENTYQSLRSKGYGRVCKICEVARTGAWNKQKRRERGASCRS